MFKQYNFTLGIVIWLLLFANLVFSQGHWQQILPPGPTTNQMVSVHFTDENTGLSVGEQGTILKTTDGGESWRIVEIPWLAYLLDIYFSSPMVGYIVGQEGCILKSTDGGESWSLQETRFTNNLHRVRFRDDQNGWIIGEKGLILYTNDGGANWQQQLTGTRADLKGISIIDDSSLCVVGLNETLLLTTDNGQNWRSVVPGGLDPNVDYHFYDVYFLNDSLGWTGGQKSNTPPDGIILSTKNGGETWSRKVIKGIKLKDCFNTFNSSDLEFGIEQVYYRDEQHAVCINGAYMSIWPSFHVPMYTSDGGTYWQSGTYGYYEYYEPPCRLFPITKNNLILTGYRGEFRFSYDGGYEWRFPNQNCRGIRNIIFTHNGKILAKKQSFQNLAPDIGTLDERVWTRSEDYGKSWSQFTPQAIDSVGTTIDFTDFEVPTSLKNRLWALYFPPDEPYGEIYTSSDCGLNWYWHKGTVSLEIKGAIFLTLDTLLRYSLRYDKVSQNDYNSVLEISRSLDQGKTVQSFEFPDIWNDIQPPKSLFMLQFERFISKHFFFDGHVGFLIGSEGNIIKTEDTGQSWKSINCGVVDDLWDITFVDRSTGFVVGEFGRILKTEDGGETWRKTNSGTQETVLAIAFKNKLEGWAGTESGLLYTKDGGETWQPVPLRYQRGLVSLLYFDEDGNGYSYANNRVFMKLCGLWKGSSSYNSLLVWKNESIGVHNNPSTLSVPENFKLEQNYPNPFNASTKISYELFRTGNIELKIYNLQGQLICRLEAGKKSAGKYTAVWDGFSEQGGKVASGVYIYLLECNGQAKSRKMLLFQ